MNLKNKIATFAAASIFALGLGTTAMAADGQVTQEIKANSGGNTLTASLNGTSSMTPFTFSLDEGSANGTLIVDVMDSRGINNGWSVTLTSQNFNAKKGNGAAIDSTGFTVRTGGSVSASKGSASGLQPVQVGTSLKSATVLSAPAGNGTGQYAQTLPVSLLIPGGQAVGTYESQITVNIAAAPGN